MNVWLVLMFVVFIYLCMGVIGRWVISPFFLSIVSMAGVLYMHNGFMLLWQISIFIILANREYFSVGHPFVGKRCVSVDNCACAKQMPNLHIESISGVL